MTHPPVVLAIGGLDPTGQAGLAADLRAGAFLGVLVAPIAAALTVQGSQGARRVEAVDPDLIVEQIKAVLGSLPVATVKLGLIPASAQLEAILQALPPALPLVLDPVLGASLGGALASPDYLPALRAHLSRLKLLTPNLLEAAAILDEDPALDRANMESAAEALLKLGPAAVLLKGGHLAGAQSPDLLAEADGHSWLQAHRIETANDRGTGCTLATLIAGHMAQGKPLALACVQAKAGISEILKRGSGAVWPQGAGPLGVLGAKP